MYSLNFRNVCNVFSLFIIIYAYNLSYYDLHTIPCRFEPIMLKILSIILFGISLKNHLLFVLFLYAPYYSQNNAHLATVAK